MANINDIVQRAQNTNWTLTDNFDIIIHNPSVQDIDDAATIIPLCTVSIDLPELTSAENVQVLGGEQSLGVKMFDPFRFTMKFKDFDSMSLRKYFETIWISQQYGYFDQVKTEVILKGQNKGLETILFKTSEAMIVSIGQVTFDNNTTAIAEFDVTFLTRSYTNDLIDGMGSEKAAVLFTNNTKLLPKR